MAWTGQRIRNLRRRLGWSRVDLASKCEVQVEEVEQWESGLVVPSDHSRKTLKILDHRAQQCSRKLSYSSLADCVFEKNELDQVSHDDIKSHLAH